MRLRLLRGIMDSSTTLLRKKTPMTPPPELAPDSRAVSQIIIDMGDNEEDDPTFEDVIQFVDALAPETLRLLDDELHSEHAARVHHLVTNLVYDDRSSHHVREAKLREYLILIDDDDRADLDMNLALIEGLHCMELLEQHKDMTTGGAEHVQRCKALIKVARAAVQIEDERGIRVHDQEGVVFLTEPRLIRLVITDADRADQIAAFISERKDLHADVISEFLATTPPLSRGTL